MKKLKIFLMMAALSVVLCACGGKEVEQTGSSDDKSNTTVEQVAENSTKNKESDSEKEESKNSEGYECLPEVLEATPEQRLKQIGDMVFRLDNSMSFSETMEVLKSTGMECTLYDSDGVFTMVEGGTAEEISMDTPVDPGVTKWFHVFMDGEREFTVGVYSFGDYFTKLSDDAVKLVSISSGENFYDNLYYCKGIRCDGDGLTYDSIKELMADYADSMIEGEYYDRNRIAYKYQWTDVNGRSHTSELSFYIDRADKTCTSVSDSDTIN